MFRSIKSGAEQGFSSFRIGVPYLKRVRSIFVKVLITQFVNLLSTLVVYGVWLVETNNGGNYMQ